MKTQNKPKNPKHTDVERDNYDEIFDFLKRPENIVLSTSQIFNLHHMASWLSVATQLDKAGFKDASLWVLQNKS